MDQPRATVHQVDGQLVLNDPDALAVIQAVEKHNCRNTFQQNADRVTHFSNRMLELGRTPEELVIVLLNVDDPNGGPLAEALMPGHDWQEYRDRGEIPFARGLVGRAGMEDVLGDFDKMAAAKLKGMTELAVVVVDRGVAEIFSAAEV